MNGAQAEFVAWVRSTPFVFLNPSTMCMAKESPHTTVFGVLLVLQAGLSVNCTLQDPLRP
ncbi:hypothetical protein FQZ97_722090 [compost metagenome]